MEAGTLDDLRKLTRSAVFAETERSPVGLAEHSGVHGLTVDGHVVRFDVDDAELADAIHRLSEAGLRTLRCAPPTLEELFLRHYGDQLDQPAGAGRERDPAG